MIYYHGTSGCYLVISNKQSKFVPDYYMHDVGDSVCGTVPSESVMKNNFSMLIRGSLMFEVFGSTNFQMTLKMVSFYGC